MIKATNFYPKAAEFRGQTMAGALFSLEGLLVYISETFTAGVIQSYQGQVGLEQAPLLQQEDLLEDFRKFGNENDLIFQEYDPPVEDNSKMGWKKSRPTSWWHSLWKAMKHAFCIQIVGGVALGSIAILILVLDFNTVDLCFDRQKNWTSLPKRTQAVMVTGACCEAYVVQLCSFFVMLFLFGWPLIKELNLLVLNLVCALVDTCYRLYLQLCDIYKRSWMSFPLNGIFVLILLMNSLLIGREIARRNENGRRGRMKKTLQVFAMLLAQFAFALPIFFVLVYVLIPLYGKASETNRAVIAGCFPLVTAMPKVVIRLAAQRIDFLHPGNSHALLVVLNLASAIVFRVMQAELTNLNLFILLSLVHGAIDLLERLTIVIRDYLWYVIYKKLNKQGGVETTLIAARFRTPRSMRLVADVSIQMILGESTSLIAAVGFIQLYKFMYPDGSSHESPLSQFFIRVLIALSIDFVFNSFSLWLQMSYLNVAVVRVWRKKWRKHVLVGLIITIVTLCYFTTHLFAVVEAKNKSKAINKDFNCTGPFTKFG